MALADLFGDDGDRAIVLLFGRTRNPNEQGAGLALRDQVALGLLDESMLRGTAEMIDAGHLLRRASDPKSNWSGYHSNRYGNADIVAIIESGVLEFNVGALQILIRATEFSHPESDGPSTNSSKAFVDALVVSNSLSFYPGLPQDIMRRKDDILTSADLLFLSESLKAGLFLDIPDLLAQILQKVQKTRDFRARDKSFDEGNAVWEKYVSELAQLLKCESVVIEPTSSNRPVVSEITEARRVVEKIQNNDWSLTPNEIYILFTEIEFDTPYLQAVVAALDKGWGRDDESALQAMVDEIDRHEDKPVNGLSDEAKRLIDQIFATIDSFGIDTSRKIPAHSDFPHGI